MFQRSMLCIEKKNTKKKKKKCKRGEKMRKSQKVKNKACIVV